MITMAKPRETGIQVGKKALAPSYNATDFTVELEAIGANVTTFGAFLSAGTGFAVNTTNEDFLREVSILCAVYIMEGGNVTEINGTRFQKVMVRKKGPEYYVMGKDGILVKTTVSA